MFFTKSKGTECNYLILSEGYKYCHEINNKHSGLAGIGSISRHSTADSILSFSGLLGNCTVNEAEMLGLKTGLRDAQCLNIHSLLVVILYMQ